MTATTLAILALADALPGGRESLLNDLAPLCGTKVYYSPEAVAQRYDVSLSCVKAWRAKGMLVPSVKIPGGTARYTLADLIKFESLTGRKEAEQAPR